MGIRDLFTKRQSNDTPGSTKVLICSLDPKFAELLVADSTIYSRSYPSTISKLFAGPDDLLNAIRNGYDVVHLFADVSSAGIISGGDGKSCLGTELINSCCDAGVKLLWIASGNHPDGYIKGFQAKGKPLNLVMTIDRKGSGFSIFLGKLLSKMATGETMPRAWVAIAPQAPKNPHASDMPATIFAAGNGSATFRSTCDQG